MHIGALTPQAVGFPVAPLLALPAASSALGDDHLRNVFSAMRDKIDMMLHERQVAGAKRQFTIMYTAFDGAYARLLKPACAMTRQVDDLTFLERFGQQGRKVLAEDERQVKAMRCHFVGRAGELLSGSPMTENRW
jgi:hypothetical protein